MLKGGAQIAYGPQTIAGAINYVTPKPPAQSSGSLILTGGNREYFNGHGSYGATVGRTGFLFDYMRKQGDGSRENLNFKLNDVNGKVVQGVGASQTLTVRGNYYSEDSNVTYSGLRQDEYVANPRGNPFRNDFFYADRYGASATHAMRSKRRRCDDDQSVLELVPPPLVAAVEQLGPAAERRGGSPLRRHGKSQYDLRQRRTPARVLLSGASSRASACTTVHSGSRARPTSAYARTSNTRIGCRKTDQRPRRGPACSSRATCGTTRPTRASFRTRFLFGGWTVTPGVRLEHVRFERTNRLANAGAGVAGNTDLTRIIPGIGVSHTTGEQVTVFGGVHRGFAPPRTEDIISNTGGDHRSRSGAELELRSRSSKRRCGLA